MSTDGGSCRSQSWHSSSLFVPFVMPLLGVALVITYTLHVPGEEDGVYVVSHACTVASVVDNWWNAILALFTHSSVRHVYGNAAGVVLTGGFVEILQGHIRPLVIFFVGGVVGVWAWASFKDPSDRYVGASPGVYALGSSLGAHMLYNHKETPFRIFWIILFILFLGLATYNVVSFVQDRLPNVAYTSHAGGALTGLFTGLAVMHNYIQGTSDSAMRMLGVVATLSTISLTSYGATCQD